MTKTAISSKGQIAIPKAVRERLNLKSWNREAILISVRTIHFTLGLAAPDSHRSHTARSNYKTPAAALSNSKHQRLGLPVAQDRPLPGKTRHLSTRTRA
jgi:hypothetical protein